MFGSDSCSSHVDLVQLLYRARNHPYRSVCDCRHSSKKRILHEPAALPQWNFNLPNAMSTLSKKRSRRPSKVSKRSRRKVSSVTSKRTKAAPSKASNRKKIKRLSAIVLHKNSQFDTKCAQESGLLEVTNVSEQNHEQDNVKKVGMPSSTSIKNNKKTNSGGRKKHDLGKVNSSAIINRLNEKLSAHVKGRVKYEYVGEEYRRTVDVGVQTSCSSTSLLGQMPHAN